MPRIGPIIPDRNPPKPPPKPTPVRQTAQFTKAQIEAKERAAAKPVTAAQLVAAGETRSEAQRFANMAAAAAAKKTTTATTKPVTTNKPTTTSNNKPSTTSNDKPTVTQPPLPPPSTAPAPGNQEPYVYYEPPAAQPATPSTGIGISISVSPPPPVKSAPIEAVVFQDEAFSEEFIVDVLFEDLVGQELLTIARNDTVNGQEVAYQPIKNLDLIQSTYNPGNILNLSETSETYFSNFVIQLGDKIPNMGNGPDGLNYYVDETNGDLIVEFINLSIEEQVDLQIATSGIIDGLGI